MSQISFEPVRAKRYLFCKSVAEWIVAVALLLMTAPLILVLAALVKATSAGPAFYSQVRLGRDARPFSIFKLRTMTYNCEAATGAVWASENDPRTTPVGRILRRTHLDELPQLWNVIRGDMSLIGPRPERPEITAQIERVFLDFRERLLVRPGISGLAQMRLSADSDLEGLSAKLAHDLHYVRHVSLSLDVRIAMSTLFHFIGAAAQAASKRLVKSYAVQTANERSAPVVPAILVGRALSDGLEDAHAAGKVAGCQLPRAA